MYYQTIAFCAMVMQSFGAALSADHDDAVDHKERGGEDHEHADEAARENVRRVVAAERDTRKADRERPEHDQRTEHGGRHVEERAHHRRVEDERDNAAHARGMARRERVLVWTDKAAVSLVVRRPRALEDELEHDDDQQVHLHKTNPESPTECKEHQRVSNTQHNTSNNKQRTPRSAVHDAIACVGECFPEQSAARVLPPALVCERGECEVVRVELVREAHAGIAVVVVAVAWRVALEECGALVVVVRAAAHSDPLDSSISLPHATPDGIRESGWPSL